MANPTGSFTGKTGRNNETGKRIKDYVYNYSDIIGRGNFAKVYRGTNEKTSNCAFTQRRQWPLR